MSEDKFDPEEPEFPEDNYELRSLDFLGYPNHAVANNGDVWNVLNNTRLNQRKNAKGYVVVSLCGRQHLTHRLVAKAFVDNIKPQQYDIVDHIDCDPGNPSADNLRWTDTRGNLDHQIQEGTLPPRIPDETVHKICQDLADGVGCSEIARKYNASYDAIYQIKRGDNWKAIADQYDVIPPKPHNIRLTEKEVIEICQLLNDGSLPQGRIAELYNTSRDAINKISTGKNWKSITDKWLK